MIPSSSNSITTGTQFLFLYHFIHHPSTHIKVAYPRIGEPLPEEHLLKHFWNHVSNFYFKKIEETEYERFQLIGKLLSLPADGTVLPYLGEPEFSAEN